jgi:hypothetical protein
VQIIIWQSGYLPGSVYQQRSWVVDSLPDKQIHERVKDEEDPRCGLLGMDLSWGRRMFGVGRSICPGPEQRDENGGKAE